MVETHRKQCGSDQRADTGDSQQKQNRATMHGGTFRGILAGGVQKPIEFANYVAAPEKSGSMIWPRFNRTGRSRRSRTSASGGIPNRWYTVAPTSSGE